MPPYRTHRQQRHHSLPQRVRNKTIRHAHSPPKTHPSPQQTRRPHSETTCRPGTCRSGSSRSGRRFPSTAATLRPTSCLRQEPRVVHDQHPARLTERLDPVVANTVSDTVDVPGRPTQQPLRPIRPHLAGLLNQRPAVLPFQARDQPGHILPAPDPAALTARTYPRSAHAPDPADPSPQRPPQRRSATPPSTALQY